MTITMNAGPNARARKTLASQLDRLDTMLDGLADGLNAAVADAVQSAVGLAVKQAVQATLAEVLTNPELQAHLRPAASPEAPPRQRPPAPGLGDRLGQLWRRVRECAANLRESCCSKLQQAWGWLAGLGRRVGRGLAGLWERCRALAPFKHQLLAALGVGAGVALAAWHAGPRLAALLSGVGGFAGSLAVQGWLWLRNALTLSPGRAA